MIQALPYPTHIQATRPIGGDTRFNVVDYYPKPSSSSASRTVAGIKSYEKEWLSGAFLGILLGTMAITSVIGKMRLSSEEHEYFRSVGFPPSTQAIDVFLQIKRIGLEKGLFLNRYVALEEGGIMLEFRNGEAVVTFEIDNDGDAAYLVEKRGQSRIADIDTTNLNQEVLQAFE